MLTIKKSSFLFRLWLAIQRSLPGIFRRPALIEKRLKRMTLCQFVQDLLFDPLLIVGAHLLFGCLGLLFAPFAWSFGLLATVGAVLFGFYPAGGATRVRKELEEHKASNEPLTSMFFDHVLGWLFIVPVEFSFSNEHSPYRRYRTLNIFGRPILPWHLVVSGVAYWIWTAGADAYRTSPDFAHQVDVLGWILLVIAGIVGLALTIFTTGKFETHGFKLLRAYLRAKKDRVCPRITFTDD